VACESDHQFPLYHGGEVSTDKAKICSKEWVIKENSGVKKILQQAKYDMIDLHLYDDVQSWEIFVNIFKQMYPDTPIIVSEFGGPMINLCSGDFQECTMGPVETEKNYSDQYHAQRILEYILTLNRSNVDEAYYFRLAEVNERRMHTKSGLLNEKHKVKSGYKMFQEINKCP